MNDATVEEQQREKVSELSSAWEAAWSSIVTDVERNRKQLRAQLSFYEEALLEEETQLKTTYDRINREMDSEWLQRRNQIDQTIGAAIKSLETFVDRRDESSVNYFREMHGLIRDIAQKQVPLYELSTPSPNAKLLLTLVQEFDRLYAEWSRTLPNEEIKMSTKKQRGILSRVKSKVRGLFYKRRAPAALSARAGALQTQFRRGLEVRMLEVATEFLRVLRLLMNDIFRDARQRWDRQKRARFQEEDKKSGITRLKQAAKGVRLALEVRERALQRARLLAQQRKDQLEKNVSSTKDRIREQAALIAQTQEQQQQQPMTATTTAFERRRLTAVKREYPAPNSLEFAKEIRRLYPQLYMDKTSLSQGNRCQDPAANPGMVSPIKPYQELFPKLLTVDSPYPGFLAYHSPGSGKTRLGWETIVQWLTDHILADGNPGAPVLVLLPTNKLIGNWVSEGRRFVDPKRFTVRDFSKTDNTAILELVPNPTEFGANVRPGYVILHKITVLLDAAAIRVMSRNLPADQELVDGSGYYLPYEDYDTHEAYRDLNRGEKDILKRMLDEQKVEIGSRSKLIIPSKTLVIWDEAHNGVNPQEISRNVIMSRTALAWSNLLKKATLVKRLLLTATPLLDDNKLTDLFKLLNLLQLDKRKQIFEGTWRASLPTDTPESAKEAAAHADELESRYLQTQLLEEGGERWRPGQKETLQQFYAGIISYVTLSSDTTVYPALDTTCQQDPAKSCSYLWNVARQDLDELSVEQLAQYGLPKPNSGKNVLVPMTNRQYKEMEKAIQSDLGSWKEHRRLDASAEATPTAEGLNFAGPTRTFKASVMQSWGMKALYRSRSRDMARKIIGFAQLDESSLPGR